MGRPCGKATGKIKIRKQHTKRKAQSSSCPQPSRPLLPLRQTAQITQPVEMPSDCSIKWYHMGQKNYPTEKSIIPSLMIINNYFVNPLSVEVVCQIPIKAKSETRDPIQCLGHSVNHQMMILAEKFLEIYRTLGNMSEIQKTVWNASIISNLL